MTCCYGRSRLLQYSCSSDIALTLVKISIPKLKGKSGSKSTLWFPNAGGIPRQLDRLDSCLLSATGAVQSKVDGDLNLVISVSKLSSVLGECGKTGALSVFPPCIHFGNSGSIWSSPFLQKAERKTESCLCVCNACLYKIVTKDKAKYYIRTWQWHRHYHPIKRKHLFFCKDTAMSGTAFKIPYTSWAPAFKFVIILWN